MFSEDDPRTGDRRALCNAINATYEFADPTYQRRVWINGEGPEVSSYSEALCSLFDDAQIERFLDGYAMTLGFSKGMLERLGSFIRVLDEFDKKLRAGCTNKGLSPNMRDADIVALPGWKAVTSSAAEFLDLAVVWLEQNCSDTLMFKWSWGGRSFGNN